MNLERRERERLDQGYPYCAAAICLCLLETRQIDIRYISRESAMSALAGKRILVVEDEPLLALAVEDMLGDLGATCVGVEPSVAGALAILHSESIDAAILDFSLRGERSTAVADWLRTHSVPFAFATGYGDAHPEMIGAPILAKPYSQDHLGEMLMRLICPE